MAVHSDIGASGAHRWTLCPGSRRMSRGRPNYTSEYAAEGTAAHELAQWCLNSGRRAEYYKGRALSPVRCEASGRVYQFAVGDEMIEGVNVYLDAIEEIKNRLDTRRVLYVIDFKYGAGIPVSVRNNKQLKYYALGALISGKQGAEVGFDLSSIRPGMFGTADYVYKNYSGMSQPEVVVFGIVQPRCEHPDGPVRFDEIHPLDLLDFRQDLAAAVDATNDPNAPLVPGRPQCDWCLAAPVCPALRAKGHEAARLVFHKTLPNSGTSLPTTATFSDLRPVERTPEMVAHDLDLADKAEMWAAAVREDAYAQANSGLKVPDWKLVEKQGRRKWINEEEAKEWGDSLCNNEELRYEGVYTEPQLKSPPQVEEAIKAATKGKENKQRRAALLEQLGARAVSVSSGLTLVREGDKRPEVKRLTAREVFKIENNPLD